MKVQNLPIFVAATALYMRVLLATLNAKYIHINLAIRLLYELNQDVEGLEWKEFTIKEDPESIADACTGFDVIALSCYIWNITQTLAVARIVKSIDPNIKILLGGPEVSYDWLDVIALDEVDFIIAGEGEIPFRQFLLSYPFLSEVKGLIRKENGEIHAAPPPPVFDLQEYRDLLPYRADPPETLRHRVAYIETSRGCPYKCEFCLASLDNKVRYLPMETIKAHLSYLMEHGRVIKFLDRTFNIRKDFTLDIFRFILENYRPGNVFQFEITADILHPDIIRFIQEEAPEGLFRFEIGIQSVNQRANLEVSRKQNFEKTSRIVKALDHKVEMHLDLIVGLPFDYWDDIKHSFEAVFRLHPPELQLGFLKFLKGTPTRDKHEQYGYVFDPNPPYQIIESQFLSRLELHRITLLEHALEIYWNKKRTPHTLRYIAERYGIFDFLLHLGETFASEHGFIAFSIENVFDAIESQLKIHFPDDDIAFELLAIDYYGYFKIRPKTRILPEPETALQKKALAAVDPTRRRKRYAVLPLHFDWSQYAQTGALNPAEYVLVVAYDGVSAPEFHPQPAPLALI